MQITEVRETIDGDPCITFYIYRPKSNKKYYTDTFVLTPNLNKLKIKRNLIKQVSRIEAENKGIVIQMRPLFARPSVN